MKPGKPCKCDPRDRKRILYRFWENGFGRYYLDHIGGSSLYILGDLVAFESCPLIDREFNYIAGPIRSETFIQEQVFEVIRSMEATVAVIRQGSPT